VGQHHHQVGEDRVLVTRPIWIVCAIVAAGFVAAPRDAQAQSEPRGSLAGAYVYLDQTAAGDLGPPAYQIGWMATGAFRLGGRWSGVGEFGVSAQTNAFDERLQLMAVLGGARMTLYRSPSVAIFAQALAGLERFSEPGLIESGPAVQPGAGVDFNLSSRVFLRAQGDYRWSKVNGATYQTWRAVAGVGVTFGSR
jgi:hypothetical protein